MLTIFAFYSNWIYQDIEFLECCNLHDKIITRFTCRMFCSFHNLFKNIFTSTHQIHKSSRYISLLQCHFDWLLNVQDELTFDMCGWEFHEIFVFMIVNQNLGHDMKSHILKRKNRQNIWFFVLSINTFIIAYVWWWLNHKDKEFTDNKK